MYIVYSNSGSNRPTELVNGNGFETFVVWNGNGWDSENGNGNVTENYVKKENSQIFGSTSFHTYRLLLGGGDLEWDRDRDLERDRGRRGGSRLAVR